MTQGFLGFLILRSPADGAYSRAKGLETEAILKREWNPARSGLVRQWKRLPRGEATLLFIRVFKPRCLGAYSSPSQTKLSIPGEEDRLGPAGPWRASGQRRWPEPRWAHVPGAGAGSLGMPTSEGNLTYFQSRCGSLVTTYNRCHLGNETCSHGNPKAALLLSFEMLTVGKRPLQIPPPTPRVFFFSLINVLCYLIWNSQGKGIYLTEDASWK